ncbi:MAG: serine/threonine-protein kinase [Thermomicrobiales bacterium]
MDQLVGTTLGRYRIERLLGRGGMAAVYQAQDPAFGRTVAVKVLSSKIADEPQFVERFLREARSMARLQHPHILPVYDVGEHQGTAYLVMLHVDGGSLHERLAATRQGKRLSLRDLLGIVRPIADALDYAHRNGVIHRDVKPQNILLTSQGYPFLTDFGIAKILDSADSSGGALTQANAVIGTPDYMSPEQGQGLPLDGRSDLYALGIILYEVFTGRTPFRSQTPAETPLAIMMRHITMPPPPPRGINPQLPPALDAVLLRALAKQPGDRYPTGTALIDALETAVESVRLPQSQGGMAAPSLSDFRLPPTPTPTGGQASNPGGTFPGGGMTNAETVMRPQGTGQVPQPVPTPAPFSQGTGGPSYPAATVINTAGDGAGRQPRRRGLLPLLLAGGALAIIALVAVLAVRAMNGGGAGAGAAATNTPAGTAIVAAGPTATTAGAGASADPASAPPSAGASAPANASAPPSGSAPASASARPSAGAKRGCRCCHARWDDEARGDPLLVAPQRRA